MRSAGGLAERRTPALPHAAGSAHTGRRVRAGSRESKGALTNDELGQELSRGASTY